MKLAIMQPYIFPYIGYFQLINAVDKFVIYDDVAYINKGWINRNNILLGGKASLFTIPLISASQNKLIREIEIENLALYRKKFLKTIEQSYKKSPYFEPVFQIIEQVFNSDINNIAQFITFSIKATCEYIGINTPIVDSSTLYQNEHLKAQERILDICLQEKANHYINPNGGMSLYDNAFFETVQIRLNFIKAQPIIYKQFCDEFVPFLSIIDVMMFNSKSEIQGLLNEFQLI
jgi:hypothetical protein